MDEPKNVDAALQVLERDLLSLRERSRSPADIDGWKIVHDAEGEAFARIARGIAALLDSRRSSRSAAGASDPT